MKIPCAAMKTQGTQINKQVFKKIFKRDTLLYIHSKTEI